MKRFMVGFDSGVYGYKSLFGGARILWLAVIPVLLSVIVPALIISGAFLTDIVNWPSQIFFKFFALDGFWKMLANAMFWIINIILSFLFFGITFYALVKVFASPFCSLIAEKVLIQEGRLKEESFNLVQWTRRTVKIIMVTIFQIIFFAVLGLLLLILSLLPGLNLFVGFIGVLIISFDCSDYALEFADLSLREKLRLFKDKLPEYLGFSVVVGLTALIPVINFLFLPVCAAGAARLVSQFDELWDPSRKGLISDGSGRNT